jgi:hypothetical protein
MYESWYLDRYDQYNDLFYEDFEVFGLRNQGSDARLGQLERLDDETVLEWIEGIEDEKASSGNKNLTLLCVPESRV